jgi:hypothetical protein
MQLDIAVAFPKVPSGHAKQLDSFELFPNDPTAQEVHVVDLSGEYVPSPQLEHIEAL